MQSSSITPMYKFLICCLYIGVFLYLRYTTMQTTLVLNAQSYPPYIRVYSKRHDLPPRIVQETSILHQAALLEFQSGINQLTITEARRRFVKQFPFTNCIESSAKLCSAGGKLFIASVLCMVVPYPTSEYDAVNMKSYKGVYEIPLSL